MVGVSTSVYFWSKFCPKNGSVENKWQSQKMAISNRLLMLFGYSLSLCRNTVPRCEQNSIWKWTL